MAQNTVLAAGVTAATSTNISVAAGDVVKVGIFAATDGNNLPGSASFLLFEDTPGGDNYLIELNENNRSVLLSGPGTYRVTRALYTGAAFGVFIET